MEEYEITWEVSAIDALRTVYNKTKNKIGTAKADKIRMELVSCVDSLRLMPTAHPLEPSLYHRPEKYRYIKRWEYKIIYQVVEAQSQVVILAIFHSKQNPQKLKEAFK